MKSLKKVLSSVFLLTLSLGLFAQSYQLGRTEKVFHDPDRDRGVNTHVFYPATSAGVDAPIADGVFPVIVFGHGFIMGNPDLYQYLWDHLVPLGYICLFSTNESGGPVPAPSHENFGLDLRFLNSHIREVGDDPSSMFYGKISDKTAIMGHSMGGKATYIAAQDNPDITTIISLAAAMSNPPIGAGYDAMEVAVPYVVVPTLVIDAEIDCVVPDDEGHKHIYYNLNTQCKTYVEILGGGHCYFASSSASNCETGEGWFGGNCASDFYITREEQNQTVLDIITPYLDYYLYQNEASEADFLNFIQTSTDVNYDRDCDLATDDPYITDIDVNNDVQDIEVDFGTNEPVAITALAQQITIRDSDNQTHQVSLNWTIDSYNSTIPAVYNATGTFTLPAGVTQSTPPTALEVTANVTVKAEDTPEDPYITAIDTNNEVQNITVPYGTTEVVAIGMLADEIQISDSDGGSHTVILNWTVNAYNPTTPDTYNATGTFTLPGGIVQSTPPMDLEVTATITVLQESPDPNPYITDIDINDDVQNITVDFGTVESSAISQLAQQITIRDSDNQTHTVSLTWSVAAYNAQAAGNYNATGTFSLPTGVEQSSPPTTLEVTATITVDQPINVSLQKTDNNLIVYPNPASNMINIKHKEFNKNVNLMLYDVKGSLVKTITIKAQTNKTETDISDLPAGNYHIKSTELNIGKTIVIQ